MDKCRFCDAELEDGSTVCPACGKENAEEAAVEAAPVTEQPADVQEQPQKLSKATSAIAVAAVVAVMVLVLSVVFYSRKPVASEEPVPMSEEVTEAVEETAPPTVPADGNPDDVTCKGTYTADDDALIAAHDTVVATAGDRELTLGQLQVFYWMEIRNFLSQYGSYASYFGLDYTQSLDTQICNVMEIPMTWQQYFLDTALGSWASYSAVAAEAEANGYEILDSQKQVLENVEEDLNASAVQNGFESALDMIHSSLGSAVGMEDYKYFMELYFKANGYYSQLANNIHPTDEELDAFFDEHADGYAQSGITKDAKYVDVRHVLIYPEGADGSNIFTEEFGDEAWAAGEAAAQALLDEWLAGEHTEESFAVMANASSQDPGSNTKGGLYENVTEGEMVQAFNDWCFDAERQVGDTGIVRTEYGFHIMYFVGSRLMWKEYAESDFVGETANAMATEITAKSPLTVKYDTILLGNCELN